MAQAGFTTEREIMGQQSNKEAPDYTLWTHMEGGRRFSRRLHYMDVVNGFGKVDYLKGRRLPRGIFTFAGPVYEDAPLSAIWLRPETLTTPVTPSDTAAWPNLRDVANLFVGFMALSILRVIIALIQVL